MEKKMTKSVLQCASRYPHFESNPSPLLLSSKEYVRICEGQLLCCYPNSGLHILVLPPKWLIACCPRPPWVIRLLNDDRHRYISYLLVAPLSRLAATRRTNNRLFDHCFELDTRRRKWERLEDCFDWQYLCQLCLLAAVYDSFLTGINVTNKLIIGYWVHSLPYTAEAISGLHYFVI